MNEQLSPLKLLKSEPSSACLTLSQTSPGFYVSALQDF